MRVLVVEDEAQIREVIQRHLEEHGFETVLAASGLEGLELARAGSDVVVLDLQLPAMDGLEVVRRLRLESQVPILIVSARGDASERIAGLEMGADDYLVKPFVPRELVARVKALARRLSSPPPAPAAPDGPLAVDCDNRKVMVRGERVELSAREFEMLRVLWQTRGKTFSREELLDRVWGPEYVGETRRVDLCVSRLRGKLQRGGYNPPIRSIWGVGYRFDGK